MRYGNWLHNCSIVLHMQHSCKEKLKRTDTMEFVPVRFGLDAFWKIDF